MPRRFPLVQSPNPPLIAALVAGGVARRLSGDGARAAAAVSEIALLAWAYQEITDGANWFRRLLGAGGAAYALGGSPPCG